MVAEAAHRRYFSLGKSIANTNGSMELDGMVNMLTDYLVGGPMQDVIMNSLRSNNTKIICSYIFIPPALTTEYENELPLLKWLNKPLASFDLSLQEQYGALLDDLFFFIGHEFLANLNVSILKSHLLFQWRIQSCFDANCSISSFYIGYVSYRNVCIFPIYS